MDGTIGEIRMFAGNFAPRNWALCQGQILPITQYQALFSILGTQYGGDGRSTFSLPDLRYQSVGGKPRSWDVEKPRYIVCLEGIFPSRS